jgi:maltose alpha-D-glucosyltransferase/alpha-amylase
MQWNSDRNAGFSQADFAQLYLPLLLDSVYGYQALNVEAELRHPSSFLQWFRRLLAVRKEHPVFGLGSFEALDPHNAAIFPYIRTFGDDVVLCVNNLSGQAQAAELDLAAHEGKYPVELLGGERFPRIGELPYLLTFGPHSFYWFQLVSEESV